MNEPCAPRTTILASSDELIAHSSPGQPVREHVSGYRHGQRAVGIGRGGLKRCPSVGEVVVQAEQLDQALRIGQHFIGQVVHRRFGQLPGFAAGVSQVQDHVRDRCEVELRKVYRQLRREQQLRETLGLMFTATDPQVLAAQAAANAKEPAQ